MKSEADPIGEDEWLLRRVHRTRFRTEKIPIISPNAFEPRVKGNDPDVDGISLYRAACLESPEEILSGVAPDKRPDVGIVRIQVRTLLQMNLGVEAKPVAPIKGHVVIPELNAREYSTSKSQFTPVLLDLARAASVDENIVRWPRDLPAN